MFTLDSATADTADQMYAQIIENQTMQNTTEEANTRTEYESSEDEDNGSEDDYDTAMVERSEKACTNSQSGRKILVNRVPNGFWPILIDLKKCSRSEIQQFLHRIMCKKNNAIEDKGVSKCNCELMEFDHHPPGLYNSTKRTSRSSTPYSSDDSQTSEDEDEDVESKQRGTSIKIKRPPNSFMIYRSERHNELVKMYKGGNKVVSKIIADEWHNLTSDEKRRYEDMAAIKKREHELMYPNYKFMPKRRRT